MVEIEPLEFSKHTRRCEFCGKPTKFFVTEEMKSWKGLVYFDADGKPRIVSELNFKEPKRELLEHPVCPDCYKRWKDFYE
jgi:hypothetical protein